MTRIRCALANEVAIPLGVSLVPKRGGKTAKLSSRNFLMLPELKNLFDYRYEGGGYFRMKGYPKNVVAPILHGEQAIEHLYEQIKKHLDKENKS